MRLAQRSHVKPLDNCSKQFIPDKNIITPGTLAHFAILRSPSETLQGLAVLLKLVYIHLIL